MSERYEWVTVRLPDGREVTVTRYTDGVNDTVQWMAQLGHHEDPRDDLPFEVVTSEPADRVWIEPLSGPGTYGPFADEVEASAFMDEQGLSDTAHKIVWRLETGRN